MSLVNYVLVGILGAIVAVALYAARWDMSRHGFDMQALASIAQA